MLYELVNPSDAYIFEAKNREVAALTVFSISTAYAAHTEDEDENNEIPLFLFGGASEWYEETFKRTAEEGLKELKKDVANALSSFMCGHFEDWRRYNAALNAIDDEEKKKKFIEEWQDGRSSLNDIGTYAHNLGEKLLRKSEEK